MKYKNLSFFLLLFSISIYAEIDVEALKIHDEAKKSASTAFANKTLFNSYSTNFLVEDHSKSFNKMMTKISEELVQRNSIEPGSVDQDSCSSKCVQYGTSELRMKLFSEVSYKIDLSSETRECQNVCKIHFAGYYGYLNGFKDAKSKKSPASTDCLGSVSSGARASKPGIGVDPSSLDKVIRRDGMTPK